MLKFGKILSGKLLGNKYHIANGVSLTIKNTGKLDKELIEKEIENIAKKYLSKPKELFEFINKKGTSVHIINNADKILNLINESEGFVLPQKGLKALYLNLILNKKFSFDIQETFILRNYNTVECVLLYQLYNWYCFKKKMEGFEVEAQNKFKNVFKICSSKEEFDNLSFDDLLLLKTAVRRDIEAIEFVESFISKNSKAKKKLKELKAGKLIKI